MEAGLEENVGALTFDGHRHLRLSSTASERWGRRGERRLERRSNALVSAKAGRWFPLCSYSYSYRSDAHHTSHQYETVMYLPRLSTIYQHEGQLGSQFDVEELTMQRSHLHI